MEYTVCPICELDDSELFYDRERDGHPVSYMICKHCGLVYQNPRKTYEEFKTYYANNFREQREDAELKTYIESRIAAGEAIFDLVYPLFFSSVLRRLRSFIGGNGKFQVLDIGCGVGGILVPFKRAGFTCKGIDAPSAYTQIGRERLGIDIEETFLSEYQTKIKYDIVILNHSLEHMLDPISELAKIRDLLADDGFLYIEIPDIERPYSWTDLPFFFMLGHVFYYSQTTLELLLNKAGFKKVYMESGQTPFLRSVFRKSKDDKFAPDASHARLVKAGFEKIREAKELGENNKNC